MRRKGGWLLALVLACGLVAWLAWPDAAPTQAPVGAAARQARPERAPPTPAPAQAAAAASTPRTGTPAETAVANCHAQRRDAARRLLATLPADRDPERAIQRAALQQYITPFASGNARALAAARVRWPDNAELAWLAFEGCAASQGCDRGAALSHLLKADAENAAAWMFAMSQAHQRDDSDAWGAALHTAATAPVFQPRYGGLYVRLQPLLATLPAGSACMSDLDDTLGRPATPEDLADLEALAVESVTTMPYASLFRCRKTSLRTTTWQDCRTLATRVAGGDTLIEQRVGTRLMMDLASDPAEYAAWSARSRDARWLASLAANLHSSLPPGYAARVLVEGEVAVLRELAVERGKWPPPRGWQPVEY